MGSVKTEKLYFQDAYIKEFNASVLSSEEKDGKIAVILDRTAFYPEGGGQPADHGWIGDLQVTDVHEKDGLIIHTCIRRTERRNAGEGRDFRQEGTSLLAETSQEGTSLPAVRCRLDWDRRFDHMQQHSGEHIVSGMLCSAFSCSNVGFHMGEDFVTIDYDAPITEDGIRMIEDRANRYIAENHRFEELWPSAEELKEIDFRSKKELSGAVRITRFPGADCCACCGTHVRSSAEVGFVKLFSVSKFREGVRIEMMSGRRLLKYLSAVHDQNILCSRATSARPLETGAAAEQMKQEVIRLKGRILSLENTVTDYIAGTFAGTSNPVYFAGEMESDSLRKLCVKISAKAAGRTTVFAGSGGQWKYAMIEEGTDLKEYVKEFNAALCGRGGGREGFAQGSVTASEEKIRAFLGR